MFGLLKKVLKVLKLSLYKCLVDTLCTHLYWMLNYLWEHQANHLGTPQNNLGTPLGVPTPTLGTLGLDHCLYLSVLVPFMTIYGDPWYHSLRNGYPYMKITTLTSSNPGYPYMETTGSSPRSPYMELVNTSTSDLTDCIGLYGYSWPVMTSQWWLGQLSTRVYRM